MLSSYVVDVSRYQKKILPALLRSKGVGAVIAKSSGSLSKDIKFDQHYTDCQKDEMPIAPYHWVDPIYYPEKQIDTFLSINKGRNIFAYVLDIEQWWNNWDAWYKAVIKQISWSAVPRIRPDLIAKHAKQSVDYLISRADKPVILYTSYGFVTSYAQGMSEWLGDYSNWVANYVIQSNKKLHLEWENLVYYLPYGKTPLLPPGITLKNMVGWQFTADLIYLPGTYSDDKATIESPIDLNLFSKEWLEKATGKTMPTAPITMPEGKDVAVKYSVSPWVTLGLRMREGPDLNSQIITVLKAGSILDYAGKSKGMWKNVTWNDLSGWVHGSYIQKI